MCSYECDAKKKIERHPRSPFCSSSRIFPVKTWEITNGLLMTVTANHVVFWRLWNIFIRGVWFDRWHTPVRLLLSAFQSSSVSNWDHPCHISSSYLPSPPALFRAQIGHEPKLKGSVIVFTKELILSPWGTWDCRSGSDVFSWKWHPSLFGPILS